LWDAQTFGLAFGIWDYEWILENVPPHVLTTWQARYAMAPWDAANLNSLGQIKYEPPDWVQEMVDRQRQREKARSKKKGLSGREIMRRYKRSQGR
jgi:hypothetical protein